MMKESFEDLVQNYLKLRFTRRYWDSWQDIQEESKKLLLQVMEELNTWRLLETPFTCGNAIKPEVAARLVKVRWPEDSEDVEFNTNDLLRVLYSHPPILINAPDPEVVTCYGCGKRVEAKPVIPGSAVVLPPEGWVSGSVHSACPDC